MRQAADKCINRAKEHLPKAGERSKQQDEDLSIHGNAGFLIDEDSSIHGSDGRQEDELPIEAP
ncbi:hypothetical protein CYR40_18215 [Chimaeribacter arupi]|uniref:hypothetical protein n=1 Tax=Chimaeribacter arupi TaxID=2060066 RepID=UPI000C7E718A|nr:hypothetical protein [Chimaeribacter arupi]PLR43140.1 hypothetical protein CYR40_18215 [Chimaeribacter arupi]